MTCGRLGSCRVALAVLVVMALAATAIPSARAQGPRVLLAEIDGPIDVATVDYVREALDEAKLRAYVALVLRLDTPGGSLDATEEIARMLLSSGIPVLGWVGPAGAHAWSAGTMILETTDIAALAPGTTMGSVQPVVLSPTGSEPVTDEKIVNAIVESLRVKMAVHLLPDRNESLAAEFVVDNLNLDGVGAVQRGAAEYVALDVASFLGQADGDRVLVEQAGAVVKDFTLSLAGAEVVPFSPSIRVRFLDVLTDPLVASLLLILGIYALIFGLSAPGYGGEIAGTILVLLALIGLGFSVDPIAIFLFVLGIILIIVELKTPGFGVLGIGGILMIIIGAVFLAPLRPPEFFVSPDYQIFFLVALLTPTASFGGFLLFALYKVVQIRRRKPTIGAMIGETVRVVDPIGPGSKGYVMYHGELWQATADEPMRVDEAGYIHEVDGIVLRVARSPPPAPVSTPPGRQLLGSLRRWLRLPGPPNP